MKQFLAVSSKRDYKDILLGNVTAPKASDILDETTTDGKEKLKARKANDNAYHDLILANEEPVPFNIVDKSVTTDLPDGDARVAWLALSKKYENKTTTSLITLTSQFNDSKLTDSEIDPEIWIVHLKVIKTRLDETSNPISDKNLMIHILHNLPE